MSLHPLHEILDHRFGRIPANRCRGVSTAIALETIAKAIRQPREFVLIVDHHPMGHRALADKIYQITSTMAFEGFIIRRSGDHFTLTFGEPICDPS